MKKLTLAIGAGVCLSNMVSAEIQIPSKEEIEQEIMAPERDTFPINNENVTERIVDNVNTNTFFNNGDRGNFLRNLRNRFNNTNRNIVTPNYVNRMVRNTAIADVNFDRRTNTIDRLIAAAEGPFSRLHEPAFAAVQVAAGGGGWPPDDDSRRGIREDDLLRAMLLQEDRERELQRAYLSNLISASVDSWFSHDAVVFELVNDPNDILTSISLPPLEPIILRDEERVPAITVNTLSGISNSLVFPIPRNFFRIEGNFPIVERDAELQNQARAGQLFALFLNSRTDNSEQ